MLQEPLHKSVLWLVEFMKPNFLCEFLRFLSFFFFVADFESFLHIPDPEYDLMVCWSLLLLCYMHYSYHGVLIRCVTLWNKEGRSGMGSEFYPYFKKCIAHYNQNLTLIYLTPWTLFLLELWDIHFLPSTSLISMSNNLHLICIRFWIKL